MEQITELICHSCGAKNYLNDHGQTLYCEGCGSVLRGEVRKENSLKNKYELNESQKHLEKKLDRAFNLIQIKHDYNEAHDIFWDLTENHPEMLDNKVAWFGRILALTEEFEAKYWSYNMQAHLDYCKGILHNLDTSYLSYYPECEEFGQRAQKSLTPIYSKRQQLVQEYNQLIDKSAIKGLKKQIDEDQKLVNQKWASGAKFKFFGNVKKRWLALLFFFFSIFISDIGTADLGMILLIVFLVLLVGKIIYFIRNYRYRHLVEKIERNQQLLVLEDSQMTQQIENLQAEIDNIGKTMVEIK